MTATREVKPPPKNTPGSGLWSSMAERGKMPGPMTEVVRASVAESRAFRSHRREETVARHREETLFAQRGAALHREAAAPAVPVRKAGKRAVDPGGVYAAAARRLTVRDRLTAVVGRRSKRGRG